MRTPPNPNPSFLIPYRLTMGVMVYTTDGIRHIDVNKVREAIIATLPPGTGVGLLNVMIDGPVMLTEKKD